MPALVKRQLELDLAHPNAHFNRLHYDAHGTVLLWEQRGLGRRWTKLRAGDPAIPELLAQHKGGEDRFLTVNEFHAWRQVRQLKSLRACYVDIDGNTDLSVVLERLAAARMPGPSFVVESGRGLHLYWELEPVPAQVLPVWQRVQDALVLAVRDVGADPRAKDCTRVLRLVGSVNSKANLEVRGFVLSGIRWTLHRLADEVLGIRGEERASGEVLDLGAARTRQGVKQVAAGSIYQRWHLVYRDIIAIGEHHRQTSGSVPKGARDAWLFIYGVALSWFAAPETLVDEVARASRVWTPSLSLAEANSALKTTLERAQKARKGETVEWCGERIDPRYHFRRQTLYDWLEKLIPDEMLGELRAVIPDHVAAERKRSRDRARSADHYTGKGTRESNAGRLAEAKSLSAAGHSTRQIAIALGVTHSTVSRWLAR